MLVLLLATLVAPSLAHAHLGVSETSGFVHGMSHPLSGLDHICAMIAVGLWAAQMGRTFNLGDSPGVHCGHCSGRHSWRDGFHCSFRRNRNCRFGADARSLDSRFNTPTADHQHRHRWPLCNFPRSSAWRGNAWNSPQELLMAQDFSLPPHSFTRLESAWASPFKTLPVRKSSASLASQSSSAAVIFF